MAEVIDIDVNASGEKPNLTIFFKCFLKTPEGMDDYLGFSDILKTVHGPGRRKPQIAIHEEVSCQVHFEKAHEKDSQIRFLKRFQ